MQPPKNLLPYLDADILAYEIAASGEYVDDEGELQILPFTSIEPYFAERVAKLKHALDTIFEPIMFLSGETNFRDEVAQKKGYKANRDPSKKPFHLANARAYILGRYNTYISTGCEADDLLAIAQMESLEETGFEPETAKTVIVTRDKDLRQCMGWHYGWESGNQPEYKLRWVDKLGDLEATYKEGVSPKTGKPTKRFHKLTGTGLKWLYAQCLLGDATDNIPGLPKFGPAKAFKLLEDCETETELLDRTIGMYKERYGESWEKEFFEQMHLVYILQHRDKNGLVWWNYPEGYSHDIQTRGTD